MIKEGKLAGSNELYEKGIAILNHFRGSTRDTPIQAPSSYDVMPGLHRLVAEWAFGGTWDRPGLEIKYRSIATISALTVLGREPQLKNHIRNGLAAGVSKEQIAEVILHVMPHGGAPTTLNALNIANEVFKDTPDVSFDPEPISIAQTEEERQNIASEVRLKVYGKKGPVPVIKHSEVYDMDYAMQTIGYIFGVIWNRIALDLQSRIICTISALVVLGREKQLPNHIRAAINLGLTREQVMELLYHLMFYGGWDASVTAMAIANDTLYERA